MLDAHPSNPGRRAGARRDGAPIRVDGDVAYIALPHGRTAIIDAADVEKVSGYRWNAFRPSRTSDAYYVSTYARTPDGRATTLYLHRVVTGAPKGLTVDHLSHDTLDNRRANLRVCTNAQNNANRQLDKRSKTGARGVSIHTCKSGLQYYCAKVSTARFFPLTPDGLEQAKASAQALRAHVLGLARDPGEIDAAPDA